MKKRPVIGKKRISILLRQFIINLRLPLILVFLALILTHCASKKFLMSSGTIDKIALISSTVNFSQTAGISGPAGIARSQFRNRAVEINEIMSYYVDSLHSAAALNLTSQLGCEVLFGKELHALPQYNDVRKKYEIEAGLIKEDENFPEVLISSEDFNFAILETKAELLSQGIRLLEPDDLKATIADLCKDLNVKYIAIAHFTLTGFRTSLIFPTDTYFTYSLGLYNENGDRIAVASNTEKTVKILEMDIEGSFKNMIETFIAKSELIELKAVKIKK